MDNEPKTSGEDQILLPAVVQFFGYRPEAWQEFITYLPPREKVRVMAKLNGMRALATEWDPDTDRSGLKEKLTMMIDVLSAGMHE